MIISFAGITNKEVEIPFKLARVLLPVLIVQHLFKFSYSILSIVVWIE